MRRIISITTAVLLASAAPVWAEFARVDSEQDFMALIEGKELRRPLVRLEVSSGGEISGTGAAWPVTGEWVWKDGYFCRDLFWGDEALGYNCQEVKAHENRIRFTSDRGEGEAAEFRLR